MANFAHSEGQMHAVNLDNVDSITKGQHSNGKSYIHFHKEVGLSDKSVSGVIAQWTYAEESERDSAYSLILNLNGKAYGYSSGVGVL